MIFILNQFQTTMEEKVVIDFSQINHQDITTDSESHHSIPDWKKNSLLDLQRKKTQTKKVKSASKSQEELKSKQLDVLVSFGLSVNLVNLFRDPCVLPNHTFDQQYLSKIGKCLSSLVKKQKKQYDEIVLYLHLIFAQIDNLQQMKQLQMDIQIVKFNYQEWNKTNIMNAKCIYANLKHFNILTGEREGDEQWNVQIQLIKNANVYAFAQSNMQISKQYVEVSLQAQGHLDIYFGPFLLNKLTFQASLWINHFVDTCRALLNYCNIYLQIIKQKREVQQISFPQWYVDQVNKIISGTFNITDITHILNNNPSNPYIQQLLIGLLGWPIETQPAIQLLNAYYDNSDWQLNSEFNPTIAECGACFQINYLIDNHQNQRETMAICVKAPSYNPFYLQQCFSWHRPKLSEYVTDDRSYIWIQANIGVMSKSGYYDWALFNLLDHGKQIVIKILDLGDKNRPKKQSATSFNKRNVMSVKSVRGRIIVQPAGARALQLHQIIIDSLNSDQGILKTATFSDAAKQIQKIKQSGVNGVYVMGVFQRDNEQSVQVYKRPHASSLALTNRSLPCRMLGGAVQFIKLVQVAHRCQVKVIVDCTTRVSASRMCKRYERLRLQSVDQHGRKVYHYGANGRSVHYSDSMLLNYRKKEAWDLLLQEIEHVINHYHIDGIYLDNGCEWPQIFKINQQQMYRKQGLNNQPAYTNNQIFQGEIIMPSKIGGYWSSSICPYYPNPLLVKLCKGIWLKHPNFLIICQGLEIEHNDNKMVSVMRSGPIPRMFKMPKALSQVMGVHLHSNGELTQILPKNITNLKKWYEQVLKSWPKNAIIIDSTTSPVWPHLAFIFKKATWAIIDLYFLLPGLTMTSGLEQQGKAYKTKALNISYMVSEFDRKNSEVMNGVKQKSLIRANSTFFAAEDGFKLKKGNIVIYRNSSLKDPSQVHYLQSSFRKQVGPQFGFDLGQIHKHYQHRRLLRTQHSLIRQGKLLLVSAQHLYGVHNNVLSFIRYNSESILLISINFNSNTIDMHYNLIPLKALFKHQQRSNLVIKITDILITNTFIQEYYLVNQLIHSKIQARIDAYKTIIWKLSIQKQNKIQQAFACSRRRMKQKIQKSPPQWIYSSIFFNQLNHLLDIAKSKYGIVKGLNILYEKFIEPDNLNLALVISKNYDFYINKSKLQKMFGIFKLIQNNKSLNLMLKSYIRNMLSGNILGPIAFVTPQIGCWSSVGGLGVMVDQLAKELVKLGEQVYIITPYYQYNKKKETNYLRKDGFTYQQNITVTSAHLQYQFGIHRGKYCGVNYIWFHNPQLFSKPYDGEGALYVTKQLVFFALITLQSFCQLKMFPSIIVTNDWMCGFVSAYVKCQRYKEVFNGTKFMHICHNLDPLYEGRLYPKVQQGNLNWLIQLPAEWYAQQRGSKLVINPSRCALQTCDNWGTVSHSYKYDLLKQSQLASVLWKHPHPFSFPNGISKDQRLTILMNKTPGNHLDSKKLLQQKYFKCQGLNNDVPLFAFIGRITQQKGVHLILNAVQSLLIDTNYKIQILVGGGTDSKQEYGKWCADKMKVLTNKYPNCFWSNPDIFFTDGPTVNIGSDFSLMPSLFEPGGIVQHQFFCGGTPVIAFKTGGLKDTVFQFDSHTFKGNGFNFISYQLQDFKKCIKRAIECYKNKEAYGKLRQNAFESVIQQQDVAKGWNNQFYRMQNKAYIDWGKVQKQIQKFTQNNSNNNEQQEISLFEYQKGKYWNKQWDTIDTFKQILKNASRLKVKSYNFCYQTKKIPRPKEVFISGNWDDWKSQTKLNFDKIQKNYKVLLKLKPGTYLYKYVADAEWLLTQNQQKQIDINNNQNHIVNVQ